MILDTLAWAELRAGRPKPAIATLTRALAQLDPDQPERSLLLHHLARAHDEAGDWGSAVATANRALRALSTHPRVAWGVLIQRHARSLSDP